MLCNFLDDGAEGCRIVARLQKLLVDAFRMRKVDCQVALRLEFQNKLCSAARKFFEALRPRQARAEVQGCCRKFA